MIVINSVFLYSIFITISGTVLSAFFIRTNGGRYLGTMYILCQLGFSELFIGILKFSGIE